MNIGWNFPSSNFTCLNGISEAGIETFRGSPYSSLAREICQNSLDAKLKDDMPVIVEFKKFYIDNSEIPGYEDLFDAINRCLQFWQQRNNTKTIKFFKKAKEILKNQKICVMRISDFNTTGLTGSKREYDSTPWQNLVKASGVSDKSGDAGGSYGIGKSAPFACSDLRTIFYSTFDTDNIIATQGVSRLVSFKNKNNEITLGLGYYGFTEKNTPLFSELGLDVNFDRKGQTGTDVYILGFQEEPEWKTEMIKSILDGFLVAIYYGKLKIIIDNEEITKKTLPFIINNYKESIKTVYNYYKVLTSEETHTIKHSFEPLGEIELKVLLGHDLHRKTLISRNTGMKLFDKGNISSAIQFAAILVLKDTKVNEFFREMETPQHNKWEPERHSSPKVAKSYMKKLFDYLRQAISEIGRANMSGEMDAEGVGEYLPDDISDIEIQSDNDLKESITDKTKDNEFKVADTIPDKTKSIERIYNIITEEQIDEYGDIIDEETGDSTGRKPTGSPNNTDGGLGTETSAKSNPEGTTTVKKYVQIGTSSIRLLLIDENSNKYKLIFVPDTDAIDGYILLNLSGEQSNFEANIKSAEQNNKTLTCSGGKIYIDKIVANQKTSIIFILDYSDNCSMEVSLYGHKI